MQNGSNMREWERNGFEIYDSDFIEAREHR
jgi:hypothetical protein